MSSRVSKKKQITKVSIKDEEEEQTPGAKSVEAIRSGLRKFAFASESGTTIASEVATTKATTKATKKRKRSNSPTIKTDSPSPRKQKVYKMELDTPHPAPANWEITYQAIEEMRKDKTAPVDTMGCHMPMIDSRLDQKVRIFICICSSQV